MAIAVSVFLSGCAAQTAYKQGRDLMAQGRGAEGLARFEEASQLEPGSAQYRMAVLQTRERLAAQAEADRKAAITEAEKRKAELGPAPAVGGGSLRDQREEQAAAQPVETALAAAYRKPITIEFKDAALRSVFEVISRSSGLNFLFDKDVPAGQKTSIFLKNSTIEAAVNLTLLTNQLEQRVVDANTVLIYPNTPPKQKDYQRLTVKSFYLSNAEAKTVAATIKALLKTRDVVVDERLNLLIVRDSPEAIRLAEKLVALHDVPEPEVMLEVEILEVKRTRLLDLGIRWPQQLSLSPLPGAGGVLTLADLRGLNKAGTAATIDPMTVKAQKTDTDANILANPRIRARNREKAKILIGERVPNITTTSTATGFVAESVTYVDVGLKLDVEPTVYLDGEVAIKVSLEVSNIISQLQTKSGSIAYQIGTRTAQTVLRLRDGENQVLAGLINDEDRRSANKVPALGDIPLVGRLFGNQADDSTKTEIVLSITPRIIRNVRRPNASMLEFDSGTETSLGARPVPAGPAPAAALPAPVVPPASGQAPQAAPPPNQGDSNPPPAPASASSALRWQGPAQLNAGDTFALQLLMQSDQPVVSVPLAIGFDARALQVTSVVEGDFLRQGGAQSNFASRVDPHGQVLVTGTRSGDTGATALGSLATVNFRVNAAVVPETLIQLLTIAPIGLGGRPVPAPLPPPHALRLGSMKSESLNLKPAFALSPPMVRGPVASSDAGKEGRR